MKIGLQGMFGLVPFTCSTRQVLTYHDLQVQRNARYASHEILGQKPVNEYVGPASDTVSFKIQLRTDLHSSPVIYLPILREMIESGEAYRLMLGTDYFGKYILTSFSEDRKFFNGHGGCIVAEVTLNLTEAAGFSLVSFAKSMVSKLGSKITNGDVK